MSGKKGQLLEKKLVFGPVFGGRCVYCCKVRLPNGVIIDDYYLFDLASWSMVMPLTAEGQVVLLREFRVGAMDYMWTFPVGTQARGESPLTLAEKELLEETGYQAEQMIFLGYSPMHGSNGLNGENSFLAFGCQLVASPEQEETEDIVEIRLISLPELARWVDERKIANWSVITTTYFGLRKLAEMVRSGEIRRASPIAQGLREIHTSRLSGL